MPTRRDALQDPTTNAMLRCDGCGHRRLADCLVDVQALPASLRGEAAHLCDGCTERLIRTGKIAREDLARLLGAPDAVVTQLRTFALTHDPIRKHQPTIALPTS